MLLILKATVHVRSIGRPRLVITIARDLRASRLSQVDLPTIAPVLRLVLDPIVTDFRLHLILCSRCEFPFSTIVKSVGNSAQLPQTLSSSTSHPANRSPRFPIYLLFIFQLSIFVYVSSQLLVSC